MNYELNAYLETIEPELRVLTRLFGFPESVWDEPKKFVPLAEELEQRDGPCSYTQWNERTVPDVPADGSYFLITFEADGHRAERTAPAPDDPDERLRALH